MPLAPCLAHHPAPGPAFCPASLWTLLVALAISLVLHLAVLLLPELNWHIPRPFPEPMRLEATLNRAPIPPRLPPPSPPIPAPTPAPEPAPILPQISSSQAPEAETSGPVSPETQEPPPADATPDSADLPEPSPEDAIPAPEAEDDIAFPPAGELHYTVYRGTQGFEIGRAVHQWEFAKGRYRITSVMETTGLAALFRPLRVETESQGKISPRGLQPEQYRMKNSKSRTESVDFDWENWQLDIGNQPSGTLQPGSQDLLSLQYQFAYMVYPLSLSTGPKSILDLWVATGKKYELYRFEILESEILELPAGNFNTIHLQSIGSSQIHLWLSPDYLMLPVKIRFTDKEGDTYEEVIRELIVVLPEETPAPDTQEPSP